MAAGQGLTLGGMPYQNRAPLTPTEVMFDQASGSVALPNHHAVCCCRSWYSLDA